MKHIKGYELYEATKSKMLGKTLRNVDSRSREKILELIKGICKEAGNMPVSELSDKYFRYERKSLRIIRMGANDHQKCESCGGKGYIETAIPTKKAVQFSSKLCGTCDGTGFEYTANKNLYKFWLSEDGKIVDTTITDGAYHGSLNDPKAWDTEQIKLPEYGDAFDNREAEKKFLADNGIVPGKTRLIVQYGRYYNPEISIGVFWQDNNGAHHFISEKIGETKTRGAGINISGTKWKDLGTHHISLHKLNHDEAEKKVKIYKITSEEPTEEPYGYNVRVTGGRSGVMRRSALEEKDINGADFVITFDFDAYKADVDAGQFKPTEDTKKEREEARKGALALQDSAMIKRANLERYRQKIADLNLKEGLGRLIGKTPHLLGGTNFLLFSMKDTFRWEFDRLVNEVYNYLEAVETGKDVDYHEKEVVNKVKGMISNNQRKNAEYIEYMTEIRKQIEGIDPRMLADFNTLHKEFERISRDFKNAYFSKKFETIEQLSTILSTIKMLDALEDNRRVVPKYIWKISDYFSVTSALTKHNVTMVIEDEWESNGDLSDSMKIMTRFEQTLKFQFNY